MEETLVPIITKPTRIAHTSANLIDDIYAKVNKSDLDTGIYIIRSLGSYCNALFLRQEKGTEKQKPLIFKHHPVGNMAIEEMKAVLGEVDWSFLQALNVMRLIPSYVQYLQNSIDNIAPE